MTTQWINVADRNWMVGQKQHVQEGVASVIARVVKHAKKTGFKSVVKAAPKKVITRVKKAAPKSGWVKAAWNASKKMEADRLAKVERARKRMAAQKKAGTKRKKR